MATYVEFVPEEEQALEVARFVNKLRVAKGQDETFLKDSEKQLQEKHMNEVLERVVHEFQFIFAEAAEKDLEPLFFVIVSLIQKLDQESSKKLIHKLVHDLATINPQEKSQYKLKILMNIFNLVDPNSSDRCDIFSAIVQVSKQSHHVEVLIPHLKDIDRRISDWGVSTKQKRELYKAIRDALKENGKSVEAHKWTTKYLSTFESLESTDQTAILEEAVNAALDAIRIPELYQFDSLLELFPVKQLESSKPKAFQLLKIFVGETLDAFNKFIAENPDFLKSVGLDHDECVNKMRILSLATLGAAASSTNNEVTYTLIAKTLHVPEDDVEYWIVTAITENVLESKMDQLRRVIIVSRSLQRVFNRAQWKQLHDNLLIWSNNINLLTKSLAESKSQSQSLLHSQSQQTNSNSNSNSTPIHQH